MSTYFKEYFTCPYCGKPIVSKDGLEDYIAEGAAYCTRCGEKLTTAFAEAVGDTSSHS